MDTLAKKPFISGLVESNIDPEVYQDVLKTHAKECITFLDYGNLAITHADQRILNRVQFTECEISPFHSQNIVCEATEEPFFLRAPSIPTFSAKPINFALLENLLINTFSPSANEHRPYPSAGALYPVEPIVFIFPEQFSPELNVVSGAYHFRAVSKTLQLIKKMRIEHFFEKLLHGLIHSENYPRFAILYVAHIGKAIFKYRYRGYRHASMEAGSMYQHALYTSQQMGLRSTLWSSFAEQEMLYTLDLDYGTYLPLTMQLFGFEE